MLKEKRRWSKTSFWQTLAAAAVPLYKSDSVHLSFAERRFVCSENLRQFVRA